MPDPDDDPDLPESEMSDSGLPDYDPATDPDLALVDPSAVAPELVDPEEAARQAAERKKRGGAGAGASAALGAAMFAMGQILEPEKTTVEIVQTDDDPPGDDEDLLGGINFGDLPPLD